MTESISVEDYIERTAEQRTIVTTTGTHGEALTTPGVEAQEAIPAETEFTMPRG